VKRPLVYSGRCVGLAASTLVPVSPVTSVLFGISIGLLWLSTVPPASSLVMLMFGTRYMAMLYGFAFFSHQVGGFLGETGWDVKVQPVIDPQDTPPVDGYEIPRRIREAMFLRMPASCFPYTAGAQRMDLDHTKSYVPLAGGGPPGQTGVHNLGPMSRPEHRIKTHSRWQVRQPEPGGWIWRSPHRAHHLVTNAGTQYLGDGSFARRVWRAAAPTTGQAVTVA